MEGFDNITIELTREQLEIIVHAIGSSSPSLDREVEQFKLYHKLLFKLNEKKNG